MEWVVPRLFKPVVPLTRSSLAVIVNLALKESVPLALSPNPSAELDLTPVGLRGYVLGNVGPRTSFPLILPNGLSSSSDETSTNRLSVGRGEELRGRFSMINVPGAAPRVRPAETMDGLVDWMDGEEVRMSIGKGSSRVRQYSIARPRNGSTIPSSPTVRVVSPWRSRTSSLETFSRTC